MKNLDYIAKDLFNKIRGRFPSVTIGNERGEVTNVPEQARYFDFDYKEQDRILGKVSISIDEDSLSVMYSNDFVANEDEQIRNVWYNFLKELRQFSKKRMLNFDTRNITKSNLNKRDYEYLAKNRNTGDDNMNESKMYGNNRTSFQKIGNAKLSIKHTEAINTESAVARSQKIGKIFIESPDGEKFRYPYKHLSGARAMAMHVSEGGTPYDDFGKHITGLSEELSKLKKFNSYLSRSSVMAESLSGYSDVVKERVAEIKKSILNLQKESFYKEAVETYVAEEITEVPNEVAENWIDQLTIKQFNEELADVFPFVYKLVSEATRAKELTAEDLLGEASHDCDKTCPKSCPDCGGTGDPAKYKKDQAMKEAKDTHCSDKCCGSDVKAEDCTCPPTCKHCNCNAVNEGPIDWIKGKLDANRKSYEQDLHILRTVLSSNNYDEGKIRGLENSCLNDPRVCLYNEIRKKKLEAGDMDMEVQRIGKELNSGWTTRSGTTDEEIESAFEELMGQFAEGGESLTPSDDEWSKQLQIPNRETWEKLIKQAKAKGDKKMLSKLMAMGDQFASKDEKTPLGEFILSYFDRNTGQFPKGETAVLTMVEKDYGEQFIEPAKQFIERINNRVAEIIGRTEEPVVQDDTEFNRIRSLAGL